MSLLQEFKDLVVVDTGWQDASTSIHNRGLHDYKRDVVFSRLPTEVELGTVIQWLTVTNCPGWTGVRARHLVLNPSEARGQPTYRFTTTMDSSD